MTALYTLVTDPCLRTSHSAEVTIGFNAGEATVRSSRSTLRCTSGMQRSHRSLTPSWIGAQSFISPVLLGLGLNPLLAPPHCMLRIFLSLLLMTPLNGLPIYPETFCRGTKRQSSEMSPECFLSNNAPSELPNLYFSSILDFLEQPRKWGSDFSHLSQQTVAHGLAPKQLRTLLVSDIKLFRKTD